MTETIVTIEAPEWAKKKHINEREFCQEFKVRYPMVYVEGCFFSSRGMEPEGRVRKWIYDYICPFYTTSLVARTNALLEALKVELRQETLRQKETLIHCANGTYNLVKMEFTENKEVCRCRLPVSYNPHAPRPEKWFSFLNDLLEPEDIPTLQEFMGYCLLPVNYAQRMLLILGQGGEGKSRIGIILHALLGDGMVNGSLTKLEKSPFARADLQNRLLMVDDDLQMEALTTTGNIKTIVTAEQPMDLEKKGMQSYQGLLFCRLMAFGNGNLRSLHDRSNGFFRRQIILTAKTRPLNRVDNPYLAQEMKKEIEGILLWCIQGLTRLLEQDMRFTLSVAARENLWDARSEGNNTLDFMNAQGYIRLDPLGEITSRRLYKIYQDWCEDNMLLPLSPKTFVSTLIANAHCYEIRYSNHIPGGNGRMVRGFLGIRGVDFT